MKNRDWTIEQYRAGKLVRSFVPSDDPKFPWHMRVNGKVYPRTHGWVLSKVLPTLIDGSAITTKVVPRVAGH